MSFFFFFLEMVNAQMSARLCRGLTYFFGTFFELLCFAFFMEETKIPLTGAIQGGAWFSL